MANKAIYILSVCALSVLQCTSIGNLAGAGSETTNSLTGAITKADGTPASNTLVRLVPHDYDIVKDPGLPPSMAVTTDSLGRYTFARVDTGIYMISAVHLDNRTRAMLTGVRVAEDTVIAPTVTLQVPGTIKVMLPDSANSVTGYVYIPGAMAFAFLINTAGSLFLDSVPAGTVPAISYSSTNNPIASDIRYDVPVAPGDTTIVQNPSWKYARRIILNTTATGADVAGSVYAFPLQVRLSGSNFDFSRAKAGGADIRFTKSDNTFLPYEIEQWDPANGTAAIWVKADTVLGNNNSQSIFMYWGNAQAADNASSAAVFDTSNGFQGVWHMAGSNNATEYDATANHYDGIPYYMPAGASASGAIGNARTFDGTSSYITMPNTANSKLNFPQDGYYSVSAWVFADTLDNFSHLIVSKGYEQYYLRITSWNSPSPQWEFVEFNETTKWETSTFPATGRQWTLLTGVRQGSRQILYCNGVCVDSTIEDWQNVASRNTSDNLSIGKFLQQVNVPIPGEGYDFFKGAIDEVRISSVAQNSDWIRLCYMNQRSGDKLVQFK